MDLLPLALTSRQYVAAAYLVFLALLLIYIAIMAIRLAHVSRDVDELAELLERESEREKVHS